MKVRSWWSINLIMSALTAKLEKSLAIRSFPEVFPKIPAEPATLVMQGPYLIAIVALQHRIGPQMTSWL